MKHLSHYLLFALSLATASAAPDEPHPKTRSMFLEELSSTNGYHMEDFYALELGKSYQLSCRLKKEPALREASAHLGVLTHVTKSGERKFAMHWLVEKLGADVPADGQWHQVSTTFTVEVPEGTSIRPNINGAIRVSLILYNKGANGSAISISDLRGVPAHVDYRFLGEKDRSLPQILLIGDSTMMHTYSATVAAFDGVAAVHYIPVNGGNSRRLVKNVRRWVGGRKWDLIYFNSGIHDLTRVNEKGKRGPDFPNAVSPNEYVENLQIAVDYLKATDAKLLWRSITPFKPEVKAQGRSSSDEVAYNGRAARVMETNGIPIHTVTKAKRNELLGLSRDGVHFNAEGNELLARELRDYLKQHRLLGTAKR